MSKRDFDQWHTMAVSGTAGGVSRYAKVTLQVECEADTVESVRRLVGAAPDLLAALDNVLWTAESQHNDDVGAALDLPAIRAAIAKARGEQC